MDDAIQIQFFCVQNPKTLSAKGDKIKYFWPIWLHPKPFFAKHMSRAWHQFARGCKKVNKSRFSDLSTQRQQLPDDFTMKIAIKSRKTQAGAFYLSLVQTAQCFQQIAQVTSYAVKILEKNKVEFDLDTNLANMLLH